MRIIGLYGHEQCGKSATLNELKELLRGIAKSYEYNLSEETQRMCNKEMAEVILKMT